MRALRGVVVLVLALALSAPVLAADYDAGWEAYSRGDYATALKEWRPLAQQGDADAQYNLGVMYYEGKGVPQDYVQAYMWFNLAASRGDKHALDNRYIVANELTAVQFTEAQRRTREWWMLTW